MTSFASSAIRNQNEVIISGSKRPLFLPLKKKKSENPLEYCYLDAILCIYFYYSLYVGSIRGGVYIQSIAIYLRFLHSVVQQNIIIILLLYGHLLFKTKEGSYYSHMLSGEMPQQPLQGYTSRILSSQLPDEKGFPRLKGLIFVPGTAPLLPMGCGGYCSFSPLK